MESAESSSVLPGGLGEDLKGKARGGSPFREGEKYSESVGSVHMGTLWKEIKT